MIYINFLVEYKKPLGFRVTKTSDGQPIDFEPVSTRQKNLQTIYFDYDTIVDFSIGIKEEQQLNRPHQAQLPSPQDDNDNENLKAEIEGLKKNIIHKNIFNSY